MKLGSCWWMALGMELVAVSVGVAGEPDGNAILRRLDAQLEKTHDQVLTMEMAVEDPGHEPRKVGMQMHMRGAQRRIAFLYPGDMKGMRLLNLDDAHTYVYLPAFRKVRRIASHVREQTMFGSDYSFEDFTSLALHDAYDGSIIDSDAKAWTVRAVPKTGTESPYGRIEVVVNKELDVAEALRFFDPDGTHIRTETRRDFQCEGELCAPRKTKMVDHRHEDHWTEVTIKDLKINSDFSPDIFSLRNLQRSD